MERFNFNIYKYITSDYNLWKLHREFYQMRKFMESKHIEKGRFALRLTTIENGLNLNRIRREKLCKMFKGKVKSIINYLNYIYQAENDLNEQLNENYYNICEREKLKKRLERLETQKQLDDLDVYAICMFILRFDESFEYLRNVKLPFPFEHKYSDELLRAINSESKNVVRKILRKLRKEFKFY